MSRRRRSTSPPTVYRKKTATVPETRAASSHLNVQTARRTQSSSHMLWILNVMSCHTDTLTFRVLMTNIPSLSQNVVNSFSNKLATILANVEALTRKNMQRYSKCLLIHSSLYPDNDELVGVFLLFYVEKDFVDCHVYLFHSKPFIVFPYKAFIYHLHHFDLDPSSASSVFFPP